MLTVEKDLDKEELLKKIEELEIAKKRLLTAMRIFMRSGSTSYEIDSAMKIYREYS